MLKRRDFLTAAAITVGSGGRALAQEAHLVTAAEAAWIWGSPLVENAHARTEVLKDGRPNEMIHNRVLTTPADQSVTTPNNDTLYSRAWIDLEAGPAELEMPAIPGRYWSAAFMDMYANNFAVLGSRNVGDGPVKVRLVGPKVADAQPGTVRCPTRWCWLLIRIVVDGDKDLPAVIAYQNNIRLKANAAPAPAPTPDRDPPWPAYFATVHEQMLANPPPAADAGVLRVMSPLGLGRDFRPERFTPSERAQIELGVARAIGKVRGSRRSGLAQNGWLYPKANLGDFGEDYVYRAQVANGGLGALPNSEAMYMRAVGPDGKTVLKPGSRYVLHFAADQLPPNTGFWSLSMYEVTQRGQFFFTPNAVNRYAISDRSPGLVRNVDGSLDIWISPEAPEQKKIPNWLPAPQGKAFSTIMRVYLPAEPMLTGEYRLPALKPL